LALGPKDGGKPDPTDKKALSDEAFMREVDDAVRAGDLESFWMRYGRWLLLAVIAGLAAFGGWIWWSNQQTADAGLEGETFVEAIDKLEAKDEKGALEALGEIKESDNPAYRAMARLVEANLDMDKGKTKEAIAAYAEISADDSLPDAFRNLAMIRQTVAEFDTLKPQQVVDRLKPLAKPGNPWFGSAGEMTAISYMKMGKDGLAGPIFGQIAKDDSLPESLRGRATQMAGSLGVDAVQLNEKDDDASGGDKVAPEGSDEPAAAQEGAQKAEGE